MSKHANNVPSRSFQLPLSRSAGSLQAAASTSPSEGAVVLRTDLDTGLRSTVRLSGPWSKDSDTVHTLSV